MRLFSIVVLGFLLIWSSCSNSNRGRHFTADLEWSDESLSFPIRPLPPGGVRLTFVSSPAYHIAIVNKGLLDHLKASGKRVVTGEFDVYCHSRGRVGYFALRVVDGYIVPVEADFWAEKTSESAGRDPMSSACE